MTKRTNILISTVLSLIILLASCADKDLSGGREIIPGENPLGDEITVPHDFDWKTMTTVKLLVKVNDEYDNRYFYTIDVFDKNPITSKNAQLLLKGYAKGNQSLSVNLTIPKSLDELFIRKTTPTGRAVVYAAKTNKEITLDLTKGSTSANSRATTRALNPTIEDDSVFPAEAPSDATPVSGNESSLSTGNYIINGATTALPPGNNIVLYVVEDAQLSSVASAQNREIYILPGKKLTIDENTLSIAEGSMLSIGKGAKLNVANIESIGSSQIYNNGAVNASGMTTLNSNVSTWINYGVWITENMTASNSMDNRNNRLYNKLIINEKLTLNDARLSLNDLSYVETKYLDMTGSLVFLSEQSYFHVTELARFENHDRENTNAYGEGKGFNGMYQLPGDKYSLVRIKKALFLNESNPYNAIAYAMGIEVVCDDHFEQEIDGGKVKSWTLHEGCRWSTEDDSTVVIPGEEGGGSSPGYGGGDGENPSNPDPEPGVDNKTYSYVFEDQWPSYGDYDMNDIVICIEKITKHVSHDNTVSKLTFDYIVKAVGATKYLAAGLMLDEILPNNVSSVNYSGKSYSFEGVGANGVETNQSKAVIPLFTDAHTHIGVNNHDIVNTVKGSSNNVENPPVVTIEVNFTSPVDLGKLDIATFNLFIVSDANRAGLTSNNRKEIHMLGYAPSSRADTSLFGSGDDHSSLSKTYVSRDNLVWALMIPEAFKWPAERVNIKSAYPKFIEWIGSGGTSNENWYNSPNNSGVY